MFLKKVFLLLIAVISFHTVMAQKEKNYSAQWIKVEGLEKKGLTKSALKEVEAIYKLALQDNNDAQQIKSSMYQIKYRNVLQEEIGEQNIFFVDTLIAKAKTPAKNILQSMQAEMYWQYLQNNRWKFYDRTKLTEEKSKDISTWSLDKLHGTISKLYKASLNNEIILKQNKLDGLDAIIIKGENTRHLRPTLFDFLSHRALEYFVTDERDLIKPAYQFSIDDPKAFAPADEFVKASFATKDTSSLHHKAILLLQQILQFHLNDAKPDALLDADLIRLNFISQYAVNEDKVKLYETALKNIEEKYPANDAVSQAIYLRAKIYFDKGQGFEPFTKTDNQYEIKRAKELCEAAVKKFPKSEGGINCQNLLNQILEPSLSLETEQVNVPGQPFRTLVKYKNTKTVFFRIVKISKEEIKKMQRVEYEKLWQNYVALKPIKKWSVSLPDPLDYQNHAAEIKVDALDNGMYIILASINENFSLTKNIIAQQLIYVSNISYIHNNENEYYVLHRDNGQPLPNTKVQVWQTKYNYQTSRDEESKGEQYTADKNGYFKIATTKEYRNFTLQMIHGNDELFLNDNSNTGYVYDSYNQPIEQMQTFLFTDRSIYRPGQTVYFKGIVIKKENKIADSKVAASFNSIIQLKDANQQKIAELKMTTNEFGSYHGSFKLPEGSLNGQFSLYDSAANGYSYFSVEEYKRPKFSVEVKKPSGTYRINDSIKVTGTAKAYAGNNVDGAAVKYRVVRKVRYPIWWGGGFIRKSSGGRMFPPYRRNEEVEITNGNATTDSKGEFNITFKALPDESVAKKDQPTFYYEVSADVTDINGETRSGETSVAVAYQALQLEIKLDDKMTADSLKTILVKSTNQNDIEEQINVTVSIQHLKSPGKIFRERYWEQADQFVMSKDEYYGYFPYDVYENENEVKNYALGDKVFEKNDSTNSSKSFFVSGSSLKAGWYKVTAMGKDRYGEEVKAEKYIQVLSGVGSKALSGVESPVVINTSTKKAAPGETICYNIKTGFDNVWLIHSVSKMDSSVNVNYQLLQSSNPFKNNITVTENDRGGIGMSYAFVKHNRVYSGNEVFDIPWSNKELNISYATFRDKLLPGSEEKWSVKISGNKGDKAAAEILAGMYDASLDQFKTHSWSRLNIWPELYNNLNWSENGFDAVNSEEYNKREYNYTDALLKSYDRLLSNLIFNYYGEQSNGGMIRMRAMAPGDANKVMDSQMQEVAVKNGLEGKVAGMTVSKNTAPKMVQDEETDSTAVKLKQSYQSSKSIKSEIQIRKNFNETAFFFPDLKTDAEGNVSFSFTMPEALTQWKLMTLAHTKDLASGYLEKTVITQKPLMVQPNAPRFMREGDRMEFSAKIVNLSDSELTGTATLELLDAATNNPIDGWFKNVFPNQYFTVAPGQSAAVKFPMEIPFNFNSAMTYRIIAKAGSKPPLASGDGGFSDGEEMALPILTNRMLVTESMPINLRGTNKKDFKFEKLLTSGNSQTITNHALTVEYTSNPVWYAVQALPYLMEYPYECAEQTFNRYYANTLATHISNSIPKIKAVFEKWASPLQGARGDTAALMSNLQKNEELKSVLLQETPWVMDAQNESQQKKNIALLFDMVKMSRETDKAIAKLKEMQSSNGGFVWFKGGPDDRYITQYIITGIGHLKKLNALSGNESDALKDIMGIVKKALPYLDKNIKEEYDNLLKQKADLKKNNLSYTAIQYLYMRSFFFEIEPAKNIVPAFKYFLEQEEKFWLQQTKYMQAMIALTHNRIFPVVNSNKFKFIQKDIIKSLKENSITSEELGMYWKEFNIGGYYWHQAPIESQALMIEAFTEIDKNQNSIDDLKTWLLKQKQTQNWRTTKATAEACYALLLNGSDWLKEEKEVTIRLGDKTIKIIGDATEAGTGYFKKTIKGKEIKPAMGNITVSTSSSTSKPLNSSTSWGSIYWQYFDDLDKITTSPTPLKLVKKLFIEKNTDKGPALESIEDGATLKVGDKVKVRIELRVDRDMEYVHMKDMRAACMEPVNVISAYKYQGGLGYYESTKDASTNFFFGWLNKGSYVFEYSLFVTHTGNFSNGITTIQCMYAPEFTSHSEGVRVTVK